MRLPMPEVSGRRADQLCDLMAMLELRAINLDHRARILHHRLRSGFHDASLARSSWTKEQEVSDRAARRGHPGEIHLIDVHDLLYGFILTDNQSAQAYFQGFRLSPRPSRI